MIYYSETDSQASDNNHSSESNEREEYFNKIHSIWENIEKTKNIHESEDSESSYQNKARKENLMNRQNQQQNHKSISKKILANFKAKTNLKEPQLSFTRGKQKNFNKKQKGEFGLNKGNCQINTQENEKERYLQDQLQKSKQNTNILMKKLIQAEQQIQYLQFELDKQITEKQSLLHQIKIQILSANKQNPSTDQNNDFKRQIQQKILIDKYELKARAAQKQIHQQNVYIDQLQKQIKSLNLELKNNHSSSLQETTSFKGSQLLQLTEAYKTIQRLAALLKSTQQYRSLGTLAQQFKNLHFLNNIPKNIKNTISGIKIHSKIKQKQNLCNCSDIKINQRLLWTPLLCYKKMLQMKLKHDTLNQQCIQEVIFQMNRLYISKQQTKVNKIKSYYENQIQKLKKRTQLTYDQILAKKQIQRLKKQIQSKKKPLNSNKKPMNLILDDKQKSNENYPKLQNLRAIGQYEDELKLREKQIKLLQQRLKLLQSQTNTYDKSLYLEGVLWIIDKMLQQLDGHGEDLKQFESRFRDKLNSAYSAEDWLRLYKDCFQSIQEANHVLIQKILTIKETTIQKINITKIK